MPDGDDFGAEPAPDNVIPFPSMRPNVKLTELWAREVEATNKRASKKHRLISPIDVVGELMKMRGMPTMPWPAVWPQLGERARTYVGECNAFVGSIGGGKCLAPEAPVLMFDGSIRRADEVRVGDKLMGPDSKPRRVDRLTSGYDEMYRIVPVKGDSWSCNSVHVLTLVKTVTNEIVDVPLNIYLGWCRSKRNLYKLYTVPVDFAGAQEVPVDPWFLGVWYGDGGKDMKSITITSMDSEVIDGIREVSARWGLNLKFYSQQSRADTYGITGDRGGIPGSNGLLNAIRDLWSADRLPSSYLTASRSIRLSFLAGLLDSDGHLKDSGTTFEFSSCKQRWAEEVAFLCRSLGLRAVVSSKHANGAYADRTYWRVHISGHTEMIPTRISRKKAPPRRQIKDALRTGFSVERIGRGPYFGWTLDGDGRFLLGDFTVTHNTQKAIQLGLAVSGGGLPVLWLNLELGKEQLIARILANMTGEHAMHVLDRWTEERIRHQISAVTDMWHFVDRYTDTDEQIAAVRDAIDTVWKVYRLPPLFVVDHMGQHITSAKDARLEMTRVGQLYEKMALDTKSWGMLLAQGTKTGQQLLTGKIEIENAAEAIGAAAEASVMQQVCSNVIVSQLYKEDDSETLAGRDLLAKARWTGREGQIGTRYSKPGGVWSETDYLPPTPAEVKAAEEAEKKDANRTAPARSAAEIRTELSAGRAGTQEAKLRAELLKVITRAGASGVAQHAMRDMRGIGRGQTLTENLQELAGSGLIERGAGGIWRVVIR